MGTLTISQFMRSMFRNAYVNEPGFEALYIRKAKRIINGNLIATIDLANITAECPGNGAFTRLVDRLCRDYPWHVLYVESVLTHRFAKKLEVMGFKLQPNTDPPSYYMNPVTRKDS